MCLVPHSTYHKINSWWSINMWFIISIRIAVTINGNYLPVWCLCLKETGRRLLNFAVPRVVAVSPQMRLIEDNPSALSLLDIYKQVSTAVYIKIVFTCFWSCADTSVSSLFPSMSTSFILLFVFIDVNIYLSISCVLLFAFFSLILSFICCVLCMFIDVDIYISIFCVLLFINTIQCNIHLIRMCTGNLTLRLHNICRVYSALCFSAVLSAMSSTTLPYHGITSDLQRFRLVVLSQVIRCFGKYSKKFRPTWYRVLCLKNGLSGISRMLLTSGLSEKM